MCLAIPAKIIECSGDKAVVEIGGVRRRANVSFVDDPKAGEYLLLHAGFAIRKWPEEDVQEYQAILSGTLEGERPREP